MACISTYYEILGLSNKITDGSSFSIKVLRAAYRQALLDNHPDKKTHSKLRSGRQTFSIDQITKAFSTLIDPVARENYNSELRTRRIFNEEFKTVENFRIGVESVDLDDLEFDQSNELWFRSCRCGDEKGFLVREKDLEASAKDGEICVECKGCSLCLMVLFWTVEEN